jgi:hypothetical protein
MMLAMVATIQRSRGMKVDWKGKTTGWLIAGTGILANSNDEVMILVFCVFSR